MKDELAERRQRLGTPGRFHWETAMDDQTHPNCRCVLLPLPDITLPRPSLWQRFKDWRSRRRAERTVRGLYADLLGPE